MQWCVMNGASGNLTDEAGFGGSLSDCIVASVKFGGEGIML